MKLSIVLLSMLLAAPAFANRFCNDQSSDRARNLCLSAHDEYRKKEVSQSVAVDLDATGEIQLSEFFDKIRKGIRSVFVLSKSSDSDNSVRISVLKNGERMLSMHGDRDENRQVERVRDRLKMNQFRIERGKNNRLAINVQGGSAKIKEIGITRMPPKDCRGGDTRHGYFDYDPGHDIPSTQQCTNGIGEITTYSRTETLKYCYFGKFDSLSRAVPARADEGRCNEFVAVHRYLNRGTGDHRTDSIRPRGYSQEGRAFYAVRDSGPGLRAIYSCRVRGTNNTLVSVGSDCEGQEYLNKIGYISISAQGEMNQPLYRCYNGSDHMTSFASHCEGYRQESILGYVKR